MIDVIKRKLSFLDEHTLEVLRNSSTATVVKVVGLVFGFLVSVFLGRILGAEGLGIISIANRVATVTLILCLLGMKQVIVKEVSIGYDQNKWNRINNVLFSSYVMNGGLTAVLTITLILFSPFIAKEIFNEPRLEIPLVIAVIVLTPRVLSRILSSALIGYNKIWQSNLVNQTLSYVIIGIILFFLWIFRVRITVIVVAIVYAIGSVFVTLSVGFYWRQLRKGESEWRGREFIGLRLLKTSLPLLLVGASAIIASNADSIMIGWLGNSKQVGLYVVAARVALLTSFFLQVTNSAISPKIAALFDKGKIREMESMVQRITGFLFLIAILPLITFLIFGNYILSIWGQEFVRSYWMLIILSIGQFFNLSTGAAGLTLMLCGEEKAQGAISITFVILNLILNYFLISNFGAIGAAVATAITVAGENITKVIFVKNKIGILTVPFSSYEV